MNPIKPAEVYTRKDVERWCAPSEIRKAQDYVARVADLAIEADSITAAVQGTAAQPYLVAIRFFRDIRGNWTPYMECSCPVGLGCKHAAATLLAALEMRADPNRLNPRVLAWIEALRSIKQTPPRKASKANSEMLFYLLSHNAQTGQAEVRMRKGKMDEEGAPSASASDWNNIERTLVAPPSFVSESDLQALRQIWTQRPKGRDWTPIPLTDKAPEATLRALSATGRCFLIGSEGLLQLSKGAVREAKLDWRLDARGKMRPHLGDERNDLQVIPGSPCCYIDAANGVWGRLESAVPAPVLQHLLALPPLGKRDRSIVAEALRELAPEVPSPDQDPEATLRQIADGPHPVLRIGSVPVWSIGHYRDYSHRYDIGTFDYAQTFFRYGEVELITGDTHAFFTLASGETVRVVRDEAVEQSFLARLAAAGFKPVPVHALQLRNSAPHPAAMMGLASEQDWPEFMAAGARELIEEGWKIEVPPGFRHRRLAVESWHADVDEEENGWFSLDLGITVEGRRLPLAPLLSALFARDSRWLDPDRLNRIDDAENIELLLPEGDVVHAQAGRIKPLARTLIDLFDSSDKVELRLPPEDAQRVRALAEDGNWLFHGPDSLAALADRLLRAGSPSAVPAPEGFALNLRPYQLEGLGWLQYLREQNLAGILADDMGLGKTAQTLAHLLTEKLAGRMDRPSLIVLPTSLVFNWRREAQLCAPALKVLALHGPQRAAHFAEIADFDVVLTTYPLIWRDAEVLAEQRWHCLILDEAQTVKNAASRAAETIRTIDARHRLCLTGTPLENHLGELWSQFDFLLPGFLGRSADFSRTWRTPIEKHGDSLRRELLARRVKPFILRRRKEEVATELPPKTIVVRSVELDSAQRDLYETVRATVDETVQRTIAAKGFQRSQIAILDALLKLRQVCCDPRLLKSETARKVKASAKIELLGDMLPGLVAEGRRILLFSQFTAMLDLIEAELAKLKIAHLRLDGSTTDRETPVRRFQAGEAPVFLISLKAGGVGLNLTAADTVIHFDPWWNPAAENQATDRAHRIGQTKNVFVYKLVVAGSIEEKILALQQKKAELAAGILGEHQAGEVKFGAEELAALLAPMP
ncbi:SNF2-related protein [Niveibacterium terrae]|uniref:SNF2-related protein n=1 Tax=Niveibacterium terrae TaxID=3373598 RepID=UPI003A90A3D7